MTTRWHPRLLACLLIIGAVILLAGGFRLARDSLSARTASLADLTSANLRFTSALAEARRLRDASVGGPSVFATDYLEGTQDSIVAADLQGRLRTMALDRRVELAALNTLSPRQSGDATLIGVRLSVRAPLAQVQSLLHAIEARQPLLFVERLVIRATQARDGSTSEGAPPLTVEVDVYTVKRPQPLAQAYPPIRIEPIGAPRP